MSYLCQNIDFLVMLIIKSFEKLWKIGDVGTLRKLVTRREALLEQEVKKDQHGHSVRASRSCQVLRTAD